mgnify:CR=1 FL=1
MHVDINTNTHVNVENNLKGQENPTEHEHSTVTE